MQCLVELTTCACKLYLCSPDHQLSECLGRSIERTCRLQNGFRPREVLLARVHPRQHVQIQFSQLPVREGHPLSVFDALSNLQPFLDQSDGTGILSVRSQAVCKRTEHIGLG